MSDVACPGCGEEDDLTGERKGDTIYLGCDKCGETWTRDVGKRCVVCSSQRLRYTPIPHWSRGRGTMQTPAGERESYACKDCGAPDCTRKRE
jgi:hypothetical protein